MGLRVDERVWNELAERDAMWAVCSLPDRRGRWTPDEFFQSGEEQVAGMLAGLASAGLQPARFHRALDFGCGLGRLTRALATRFDEVVGVDLSQQMIQSAQQLNADRPNSRFIANTEASLHVLPSGQFDLIFSLIALQHVSSRFAIRSFARVAASGGVIAFQLPTKVAWRIRLHPLRLLNRLVPGLPWLPRATLDAMAPHAMALNGLPEREVRALLEHEGAHVETAFEDRRTGTPLAPSNFYLARVPA